MSEQEHWSKNPRLQRLFFAWLKEAQTLRGLSLTYENVKAELGIQHLADWTGDLGSLQKAVIEYLDWKRQDQQKDQAALPGMVDEDGVSEIEVPW